VVKKLNLNVIRADGGTQVRESLNQDVVSEYAEALQAGAAFPPMDVFHDGSEYWLADGFHRLFAYRKIERASAEVEVHTGTLRDAMLFAAGANPGHGLRRTSETKRRAVLMLLDDAEWAKWSQERIAKQCAVSPGFVSKLVAERRASLHGEEIKPPIRTVERAGKTYQQDTSRIGKAPAPPAASPAPAPAEDFGPSEAEIAAAERALAEELTSLRLIAESDDKLKAALDENNKLRALNRVLQERVNSLMNEKNAAIVAAKRWEKKAKANERAIA
jgi:hypothetical protein